MSRCEATEVNSPTAMEKAPASSPAKPVTMRPWESAPAPATPSTSERLERSPSFTPKMAARSDPPRPPRCHCSRVAMAARASMGRAPPRPVRTCWWARSSSAMGVASAPPCFAYLSASPASLATM